MTVKNDKKTTIGIVVPVYNTEEYLGECLDSLLCQTYPYLKVVLVDDGSKDRSIDIAKEYSKKDERVVLIELNHVGVSKARNNGIDYCLNDSEIELITFVDSDDTLQDDYLEVLYRAKTEYNSDASCCMLRKSTNDTGIGSYAMTKYTRDELTKKYFEGVVFYESPCLKLFDKEVYRKVRFREGMHYEDTFICYELINSIDSITYADYYGYNNRVRPGSTTQIAFSNVSYDKIIACKEMCDYYKESKFYDMAYNKYLGALIYFILKTNKNRKTVDKNPLALKELKKTVREHGLKNIKPKFVPFIILNELNLLRFIPLS